MLHDGRLFIHIIISVVLVIIIGPCMLLILSGQVDLSIDCFGVDSSGKVYVGLDGRVEVYKNGEYLYRFDQNNDFREYESNGRVFTVTADDRIVMAADVNVYYFDLDGNLLSFHPDNAVPSMYGQLHQKRIESGGDIYEIKHALGRTCIIKNDSELVYQISPLSVVVKIVMMFATILFIPNTILLVLEGIRLKQEGFL